MKLPTPFPLWVAWLQDDYGSRSHVNLGFSEDSASLKATLSAEAELLGEG